MRLDVVVLIPYRAADVARVRAWEIARPYYEALGYPIHLGDNEGPEFARAAAINAAAAAAGEWDVAIIADADTVQEAAPVKAAVGMAFRMNVVPWRTRYKLSRDGTEKLALCGPESCGIADLDQQDGFAHPDRLRGYPATRTGSTLVVSRAAWERARGFDEGYAGWGYEDQDFRVRAGHIVSIPGRIWHLWHPLAPRDERTKANAARFRRMKASR